MSIVGTVALCLVTAQLVATAVHQRSRAAYPLLDMLGIVPGWTFFVQPSSTYDIAIDARWRRRDGGFDDWQAVATAPTRRWRHSIWCPEAIANSSVWLAVVLLDRRIDRDGQVDAESSFGYDIILSVAKTSDRYDATGVQFALVRLADGGRTIRFVSDVHDC